MLEGERKQELFINLSHRLREVEAGVSKRQDDVVVGTDLKLSVGELSERRINPKYAVRERLKTYDYYNLSASYVPDQKVIEREIALDFARRRTERVNKAMSSGEVVVLEGPQELQEIVY